jgi:hypothetical protein
LSPDTVTGSNPGADRATPGWPGAGAVLVVGNMMVFGRGAETHRMGAINGPVMMTEINMGNGKGPESRAGEIWTSEGVVDIGPES